MKIVYQGSPGAYSHLAAKKIYPEYEPISQNTFEECFNPVSYTHLRAHET